MSALRSRKANRIPGSTLRVLTKPATDTAGLTHPAGTVIQPGSFGQGRHGLESRVMVRTVRGSWVEATFAVEGPVRS